MRRNDDAFTPEPPEVGPRYGFSRNGDLIDEYGQRIDERFSARQPPPSPKNDAFAKLIAQLVVDKVQENIAALIDEAQKTLASDHLFCAACSHDDCKHYHQKADFSVRDVVAYLNVKKATIYTWLYHQQFTRPVSGPPYLWDSHIIGCFKHDHKVVFSTPQYDREEHLRLLREARATTAAKKAATHATRSAHAMRLNASRKTTRKAQHPKKISKATKRGAK